jgi:hypothetical protein
MIEDRVQRLLDAFAEVREKANVDAVFGEPVSTPGRTVIPVAEVAYGFELGVADRVADEDGPAGGGAGASAGDQTAGTDTGGVSADTTGGGALHARPLAVIEVTPAATVVRPIVDQQKVAWYRTFFFGWAVFWFVAAVVRILGPRE